MILICFDGSADSRAAVEHAAQLFGDAPVTVLSVWEPFVELIARTPLGFGPVPSGADPVGIDEAGRKAANEVAVEGAALATRLGMKAVAGSASRAPRTARAILLQARELEATAIVMGSRGLTGVKSLLLGSVSREVIRHADRAVVVVPSPEVAASRVRGLREATRGTAGDGQSPHQRAATRGHTEPRRKSWSFWSSSR
jgi:nucleotide-binding universal stress UspA family protein